MGVPSPTSANNAPGLVTAAAPAAHIEDPGENGNRTKSSRTDWGAQRPGPPSTEPGGGQPPQVWVGSVLGGVCLGRGGWYVVYGVGAYGVMCRDIMICGMTTIYDVAGTAIN